MANKRVCSAIWLWLTEKLPGLIERQSRWGALGTDRAHWLPLSVSGNRSYGRRSCSGISHVPFNWPHGNDVDFQRLAS